MYWFTYFIMENNGGRANYWYEKKTNDLVVPILASLLITAIHFARFYYNIKKISDPYLIELERKYLNLANNSMRDNFRINNWLS